MKREELFITAVSKLKLLYSHLFALWEKVKQKCKKVYHFSSFLFYRLNRYEKKIYFPINWYVNVYKALRPPHAFSFLDQSFKY